jgi:hypothetical protein
VNFSTNSNKPSIYFEKLNSVSAVSFLNFFKFFKFFSPLRKVKSSVTCLLPNVQGKKAELSPAINKEDDSSDEGLPEKEWVPPEGEKYHLCVLRDNQKFPIEMILPVEAKVADLYRTLRGLLGSAVAIRTVNQVFPEDSNRKLAELHLKNLFLDVVVNPG